MLKSLARGCYQHRWLVVVAWIVLVAALIVGGTVVGTGFRTEFDAPPGTESAEAVAILEEGGFDTRTGTQAQVVFQAQQGVDDPEVMGQAWR